MVRCDNSTMRVKALLFDFSRTLLFPKDKNYDGGLNSLHQKLSEDQNYKFLDNFELNSELMKYSNSIKDKVSLYIFTSESIQEDPSIKDDISKLFIKIYSAKKMGMSKKDPESYKHIAQDIGLNPGEILFIDDSQENLDAAKIAGLATTKYTNNPETIESIKQYVR